MNYKLSIKLLYMEVLLNNTFKYRFDTNLLKWSFFIHVHVHEYISLTADV